MANKATADENQGPDAWNDKAFEKVFNLFEEDDGSEEPKEGEQSGLDRSEFTKLVKRIAQL